MKLMSFITFVLSEGVRTLKAKPRSWMQKMEDEAFKKIHNKDKIKKLMQRKRVDWTIHIGFWWHPTENIVVVGGGKYHTTVLAKNLKIFGLTEKDLDDSLKEWEKLNGKNYVITKDDVLKGYIDLFSPLLDLAYENGWVRAYGGRDYATAEGSDMRSLKMIVKEYVQDENIGDNGRMQIILRNRGREMWARRMNINQLEVFAGA